MKRYLSAFIVLLLAFPVCSGAEEFLEAPVISGVHGFVKTDSRLEMKTQLSHDEVVSFYRKALKDFENIKFRDWKEATYIEDDGKMPWHSITISKGKGQETSIIIVKDNWTWIIGTLILRYIGVFMVLMVLFLGMAISGRVISGFVKRIEGRKEMATV